MSNTKHSPGPWTVEDPIRGMAYGAPYIVDADGFKIGMALHWLGSEDDPIPNAYLMAAAPTMLAALEKVSGMMALTNTYMYQWMKEELNWEAIKTEAERAIALAKGELDS